jgi:hypothetical protein
MTRTSWLVAAFSAAALTTACASNGGADNDTMTTRAAPQAETAATPTPPPPAPAQPQGGIYSDAQLQAFIAASTEIDPINRTLATATPEQQAQAATQIRAILDRTGLNGETYNAIASQAQSDPAFAARINALRAPPAAPAGTTEPPEPSSPEPTPTNPQ